MRPTCVGTPNLVTGLVCTLLALLFLSAPTNGQDISNGSIRGDVVDESGMPVAAANIVITALSADGDVTRIDTTSDGKFLYSQLRAGLYTISATQDEIGSDFHRVRVRSNRTVEVRFKLQPGGRLRSWVDVATRDAFANVFSAGVKANRTGAYDEAATNFSQAAELDPTCLECHYNTGVAYTAIGQLTEAEMAFRRALAINNNYAPAYYGLSALYVQWERPRDASTARAQANRIALASLDARRQQATADVNRGITFYEAGNHTDAQRQFQNVIDEHPTHAPAYYWLGVTLVENAKKETATRALRRYLSLDPDGRHAELARNLLEKMTP